MSRSFKLDACAMRVLADSARGAAASIHYYETPRHDKWNLESCANPFAGLPYPFAERTIEYWFDAAGARKVHWAPNAELRDSFLLQWRNLSPGLVRKPIPVQPPLRLGSYFSAARLSPTRVAAVPFKTEFGHVDYKTIHSPLEQVLQAIPRPRDDSFLVVQQIFRRNHYDWPLNPFCHLDLRAWEGTDELAMQAKRASRMNFYTEIRILEAHADADAPRLARRVHEAYQVFRREKGNRFRLETFPLMTRQGALRWLWDIGHRVVGYRRLKHRVKPHLGGPEQAVLHHPLPPGAVVPDLMAPHPPDKPSTRRHRADGASAGG